MMGTTLVIERASLQKSTITTPNHEIIKYRLAASVFWYTLDDMQT